MKIHSDLKWQDAVETYAKSVDATAIREVGGTGMQDWLHVPEGEPAKVIVLHEATPELVREHWAALEPGGVLCGLKYEHPPRDEVPEMFPMRAVAEVLPLLSVGVGPNGLWFAYKVAA